MRQYLFTPWLLFALGLMELPFAERGRQCVALAGDVTAAATDSRGFTPEGIPRLLHPDPGGSMNDVFNVKRQTPEADLTIDLGSVLGFGRNLPARAGTKLILTWKHLAVHVAALGGSGSGKSFLLALLMRHFLSCGLPFVCIDPANDLAHATAAYVAALKASGDDETWRKFHLLEVRPEYVFAYDPFANAPLRGAVSPADYYAWLETRVDRVYRAFLRRVDEASKDLMMRLQRWMKNIITACGVAIDGRNTHVGLDNMLLFTDPQRPEFTHHFARVEAFLRPEVRADFQKLIGTRRGQDQEKWLESTINRLRDIMKGLVPSLFAPAQRVLNVQRTIEEGGFIVAALGQTQRFSHDQKVTVGGLLIDDLLTSKEADEEAIPEDRVRCALIVDEIGEFLGDDLERAFATHRKYNLSVIVGGQNLSTLCRGDLDMGERVLSQTQTKFIFQQTLEKDLNVIVPAMCLQNISFKKHFEIKDRPDGVDWHEVEEYSDTSQHTKGRGKGTKQSTSRSGTKQRSGQMFAPLADMTRSDGQSEGVERGETAQEMEQFGQGHTVSHKKVPLARTREEIHETPSLKDQVNDQLWWWKQQFHGLDVAECIVKVRGIKPAFFLRVAEVKEWWQNDRDKYAAIERLRERLRAWHPYYVVPVVKNDTSPSPTGDLVDRYLDLEDEISNQEHENPFDGATG